MTKTRTVFECQTCASQFPKWLGRCNECGGWNTLVESIIGNTAEADPMITRSTSVMSAVVSLRDVDILESTPIPTGIDEFDHVVGGGLVPGSVTLIGGEPGIGKSTLVMQIVGSLAKRNTTSLYASAEESNAQIRGRA
ncbi:MAG TPA: ATPase domain-containing protein, partial [Acidimicrobiia bacterium]|nr:ATPase domain-containing protein [Acidimicrobiia bacterium]